MRMRKFMVASLGALVAALAVTVPSAAAQSVGGCQLEGTAQFSPGLNSNSQPFEYSFSGTLASCQSSQSGAPTSGTVSAGKTLAEQVTNSITGVTHTVTYQEPVATGSGGCGSSTTEGQSLATWSDGSHTVVAYSTTGALAAVSLSGSVVPSMTLTAVNAEAGDPATYTIATNRYSGESALGALAFQPPDPTACLSAGATTAGISGVIGLGGA
jgi:hypothetical protein